MRRALLLLALVSACAPYRPPSTIEPLGDRLAATDADLGPAYSVRVLSDGRVLIGDDSHSRVLLLDDRLQDATVVADSTPATDRAYPHDGGAIRRYLGDSTLIMVSPLPEGVVLDPQGRIAHRVNFTSGGLRRDVLNGLQSDRGTFAVALPRRRLASDTLSTVDTVYAVLGSLTSARRDTVGSFRREHVRFTPRLREGGSYLSVMVGGDAMTMLSGGSVAIVRGSDYHIDWIDPDSTRRSTPPVPHEWHALTHDEKVKIIAVALESAKHVGVSLTASMSGNILTSRAGSAPSSKLVTTVESLPDTVPPFQAGAAYADAENHLWVRQRSSAIPFEGDRAGDVYDIIDVEGRLIRKVKLPPGALIKTFRVGIVYYAITEDGLHRLVAAKVR